MVFKSFAHGLRKYKLLYFLCSLMIYFLEKKLFQKYLFFECFYEKIVKFKKNN